MAELSFLTGGGETGALVRAHDWSATPLGPAEGWPQSLRSTLSVLLNSPILGAVLWGPDLLFLYNDAYVPSLADRHPGALGRPVSEVWGDAWSQVSPAFHHCLATGEGFEKRDVELPIVRNGRSEITYWNFSAAPIRGEDGTIVGLFNQGIETTAEILEDRRRVGEIERQRNLLQQMPGFAAVLAGPDHVFEFVNEAYVAISGPRTFLGHTVREVFPELTGQGFYELLDRTYATGEPYSARALTVWFSDMADAKFVDLLYQPIKDGQGQVTGIFVGGYDVTERVRAETYRDVLMRLTDRIRDVNDPDVVGYVAAEILGETLNVSRVGYGTVDLAAETLHVERDWTGPEVETLAGIVPLRDYGSFIDSLKRGELVEISDVSLDDRTSVAADALAARHARSFVNIPVIEHGQLVAVLYVNHATVREWPADEIALIKEVASRTRVAVERSRNDAALLELNTTLEQRIDERSAALRLHENIIQSDITAICAFDTDFRLIAFNTAHNDEFFRVNGFYTKLGDVFPDLFVEEQRPLMRAQMARALSGESFTVEEEFGNPAIDAPRWEIHYSPLRDSEGTIVGAFHHARDVSARLRAQAELADAQDALRQSQKMEAMGQLTGGVAHDFNNLLTPIVGVLDMLQRRKVGGEREQRLIDGAVVSADRARILVQRLLAFARRQPLQTMAVDVAALVRNMADLVASTTGPQIRVVVDVGEDLPPASADPNQLEMALLNLAVNGRDAMPDGGTLRITASSETVDKATDTVTPGRYIRLSVADSGIGMSEETMARAVEPFYSTKGVGKGTGLGLSMVHGLASQLGGGLRLSSRPGLGTNVELWLPESVEDAGTAPGSPVAATALAPSKRGTALLVDDEEYARLSTADMLGELGFDVVEAETGEAALALIENGLDVALIITDHLMPGMNGSDLAREIRQLRSELPVLVISGYAESEGIEPDLPRLTKPFRRDELVNSLVSLGC